MAKEIEIPEGYEARIEGNKVIIEPKESEDERIRKRIRLCLDECVHSDIIRDYERDECLAYLEKQKEQQPSEWGEEDEEHLDSIIESYKELLKDYSANNGVDYIPYNTPVVARTVLNDIKFLKSLHPQPKQEWSDEEQKTIDEAVIYIENYAEYVQGGFSKQHVLSVARRVDSLRPIHHITYALDAPLGYDKNMNPIYPPINHWKPSEEQMEALECAVNGSIMQYDYSTSQLKEKVTRTYSENLQSLYEQLKKLKKI